MGRIPQPAGTRGSLKWIQRAVNQNWASLNQPIFDALDETQPIDWRSPLMADDFAEYRDAAFLTVLGQDDLKPRLDEFWPACGPQWDALGVSAGGVILLVEAKAHIAEMCTSRSQASPRSLARISAALDATAKALGANPDRADWHVLFYQLANRLAHLFWLRNQRVDARLVLVNFLNDPDLKGPTSAAEWQAAYKVANYVLGLKANHPLSQL